ncbi:MAG TPA: M23 family metallopeptidase [Microlunatus sp.]
MDQTKFELGDKLTPLIITPVGPDPVPVLGTDHRRHLAYELTIFNSGARPATITRLTVRADEPSGPALTTMTADEIIANSLLVGEFAVPPQPVATIASGSTTVVIMDMVLADDAEAPRRLVHEVRATFGEVRPQQAEYAQQFPHDIVQLGGVVVVDPATPITIGAPLTGPHWFAANACGPMNAHRGAVVPVGGRLNPAERYAIDWVRIDPEARPLADEATGLLATFRGDRDANQSYYAWDQPVLAVGAGEIVTVFDELPDATPQVMMSGIPFDQLGGNHVVLRLADEVYAFYAHLRPGTMRVRVGDQVRPGQELARTGNSGNTSEAHLHFHVMASPFPLDADNLPFVINEFGYEGQFAPDGVTGGAGERRGQLPLVNSVIGFPGRGD